MQQTITLLSINNHLILFCFVEVLQPSLQRGHTEPAGYLVTLFLDKPPGGSSPALKAYYFASNWQFALLETIEEEEKSL